MHPAPAWARPGGPDTLARVAALLPEDVVGAWAGLILPFGRAGEVDGRALAVQLERLVEAGVAGLFAADDSAELAELDASGARAVQQRLAEVGAEVGLPVVLDARAEGQAQAVRRIALGADLDPAAWLVSAPVEGPGDLVELETLARAASPSSLILEEPRPGAFDRARLARWSSSVPQIVGARMRPRDEERWSELAPLAEDLALFAAGRDWASASRWGARSSCSELVALSPALAVHTADLIEGDVQRALRRERAFQNLLEVHAQPLLRRASRPPDCLGRILALVGGWSPGLDLDKDGRALLDGAQFADWLERTHRALREFRRT